MRGTDDSDLRLDLERAAARLTDRQRRALWLWCQGYTQREIAVICGVTQRAIRYRLCLARTFLLGVEKCRVQGEGCECQSA